MKYLFLCYSRCSTCRRARAWLDEQGVDYVSRDIVEDNPSREELEKWFTMSERPLKSFFNTSGRLYRELGLKDRLPEMSEAEQLELLATDGLLVKRPLLLGEDFTLVGFRQKEWEEKLT
ncbi:MAG: arsenate reductase family protein [Limnochordia bacterium]